MDTGFLLRGLVVGVAIAAPVGPIGVLCIRRTLADGRATGFASGMGAATADLIYGTVAALGLTAVAGLLEGVSLWTRLLGGLFLCYLGVRTLLEAPSERPAAAGARGLLGAYASTFALTITNPATIIAFAAVFAGMGAASGVSGYGDTLLLVAGVFSGSALWWLLLSGGVSLLRSRVTPTALRWVNRSAGLIILGFGVAALASLL
ncbi:LysE family transporter [Chloroflexales bacterium ZM16-3]|nr:LysE family transporter [Chloroflexales bacterium ZM16-3]